MERALRSPLSRLKGTCVAASLRRRVVSRPLCIRISLRSVEFVEGIYDSAHCFFDAQLACRVTIGWQTKREQVRLRIQSGRRCAWKPEHRQVLSWDEVVLNEPWEWRDDPRDEVGSQVGRNHLSPPFRCLCACQPIPPYLIKYQLRIATFADILFRIVRHLSSAGRATVL